MEKAMKRRHYAPRGLTPQSLHFWRELNVERSWPDDAVQAARELVVLLDSPRGATLRAVIAQSRRERQLRKRISRANVFPGSDESASSLPGDTPSVPCL